MMICVGDQFLWTGDSTFDVSKLPKTDALRPTSSTLWLDVSVSQIFILPFCNNHSLTRFVKTFFCVYMDSAC